MSMNKKDAEALAHQLLPDYKLDEMMVMVDDMIRGITKGRQEFQTMLLLLVDRKSLAAMPPDDQAELTPLIPDQKIGEDTCPVMVIPVNPHDHWHDDLREMGKNCKFPILAAFMASSAWASKNILPPGSKLEDIHDMSKRKYRYAREDPDRTEVILLGGMSLDGRTRMRMYEIERPSGVIGEGPLVFGKLLNERGELENYVLQAWWQGYMRGMKITRALKTRLTQKMAANPNFMDDLEKRWRESQ